jgi:hypothetical protein
MFTVTAAIRVQAISHSERYEIRQLTPIRTTAFPRNFHAIYIMRSVIIIKTVLFTLLHNVLWWLQINDNAINKAAEEINIHLTQSSLP